MLETSANYAYHTTELNNNAKFNQIKSWLEDRIENSIRSAVNNGKYWANIEVYPEGYYSIHEAVVLEHIVPKLTDLGYHSIDVTLFDSAYIIQFSWEYDTRSK